MKMPPKYTPEYLEAKKLKEKKRQSDYYQRITKPYRQAKRTIEKYPYLTIEKITTRDLQNENTKPRRQAKKETE